MASMDEEMVIQGRRLLRTNIDWTLSLLYLGYRSQYNLAFYDSAMNNFFDIAQIIPRPCIVRR